MTTGPESDEAEYRGEPEWVPEDLVTRGMFLTDEALELLPRVMRLAADCEEFEHAFDRSIAAARPEGLEFDAAEVMFDDWSSVAGVFTLRRLIAHMGQAIDYHLGGVAVADPKHRPEMWEVLPVALRWRDRIRRRLTPAGPDIDGRLYRQPDPWGRS